MYSTEQRRVAIETFIRFDHSYADTIAELGYPDRHTLRNWWGEYRETGEVPIAKIIREPRFSDEQKREAVEHYLSHGKRLKRTMRALGYPKSRMTLCGWVDELAPPSPWRRRCRSWPSSRRGRGLRWKSPRGTACRARRRTCGAGKSWGIMSGTPRREAFP